MPHSFAYLFERFPSFVQTFVYREAIEMNRQQMAPWLVSVRRPDDPGEFAENLEADVFYLPEADEMRSEIDASNAAGALPARTRRWIAEWRKKTDSNRVFEAAWLGPRLRERGIRHVHAHFGGLAARTAWMLRKLHGFSYSFTGHANDIFCDTDFPVTNEALVRGAHFVVTETDYARRWMERKYPFARGKVHRIFNGIAMDGFPPRQPPGPVPRIVSVGRYVEKKGFSDLIEACRLLREREVEFECDIIGGGPLETVLREQIAVAGLEDRVHLLGPRAQREVREALARAQVFALACVPDSEGGSDNLPTVIMEAMACGTPVVSTELAGVPEMIVSGVDGFLTQPGAPRAFADALGNVLRDPELAARCGASARRSAVEKFSIEKVTSELKQLLVRRAGVVPPAAALAEDSRLPRLGFLARLARRFMRI